MSKLILGLICVLLPTGIANCFTQYGTHLDNFNVYYSSDRADAVNRAKQINVQIARNSIWWNNVESYQGQANWSVIDSAVNEEIAVGIEPLVTLVGSPAWANGSNPSQYEYYYQIPSDPGAFSTWVSRYAAFAASAAQRLKGRVTKYELWNEENEHFTWQPFPNPDQYAAWFRAVSQAIKSVDPNAQVSIGGLTGLYASGPTDYNGLNFLQELFNRGVYPDVISIHPYTSSNQAPDQYLQWQNNFTDIGLIHDKMVANDQGNKPIWLTEWGWDTSAVGEAAQANYVQTALNMIKNNYPYVAVSTYFLQSDLPPRYYSGLFDSNGRLRDSAARFRDFVASLGQTASSTVFASDLPYNAVANGWGPVEKDQSNGEWPAGDGRTISIADAKYAKGFGVHSPSEIDLDLSAKSCSTFTADVGMDDETYGQGAASFQIWADGDLLIDSGAIFGRANPRTLTVNVSGRRVLRLVVSVGPLGMAYGHADWAQARLTCTR